MKFLYQVLYVSILPLHTNLLLCNLSCYDVNNEATEPRVEVITSTALRLSQWLGLPIWNICVANDQGYVQPVENAFRSLVIHDLSLGL
jgi:hypothetical protein